MDYKERIRKEKIYQDLSMMDARVGFGIVKCSGYGEWTLPGGGKITDEEEARRQAQRLDDFYRKQQMRK